ncbi:MAG: UDP-2,3-diacylglucosamine diphosphatase, partial [Cyclobacteriaceae bacterium]|nr:UDP-2,3-diacylglucosamine diphosphatase [Cyclobacteriaceae bacterium]
MIKDLQLPPQQKFYFASDFHLGEPDYQTTRIREGKVISWLDQCKHDAAGIFLLGDIFDFWFEYRHVIPKGYTRLLGKLAEISDSGIPIYFFTGNHDMWLFDYMPKELNITVFKQPQSITVNGQRLMIGHGDGLGPGEKSYKLLKLFF